MKTLSVQTLECFFDCATLCSFFPWHTRWGVEIHDFITVKLPRTVQSAFKHLSVAAALALSDLLKLERQPNE